MAYWIKYNVLKLDEDTPHICSNCGKVVTFRPEYCPRCKERTYLDITKEAQNGR